MPSFCAVLDCVDKYGHGKTVPFHKFPTKNKELLEKWIQFTQRPTEWRPSRWMSVCGLHFRDEDYRCLEQKKLLKKTAVPSVRTSIKLGDSKGTITNENKNCNAVHIEVEEETTTCDLENQINNKSNVNCRFCDCVTTNFQSFAGNFEIFGVIQKCLPTLSICQDDNLPKEICCNCLKRLESFANFIDKVLETQAALLRRFRHEKDSNKPTERTLKIKQEPVVRVKQENSEDVNAFFPDEVDDGGDAENDASNTDAQLEQKFQFCDFPVLNDQDLINNCDIMEIINLSDPFIDITNCENTIAEEEQQRQQQQAITTNDINNTKKSLPISTTQPRQLQTAHELLQAHLLIEEHNYAYAAEDFKEEWQIKNCYKTEKIEADECEQNEQHSVNCDLSVNEPFTNLDLNFNGIIDDGNVGEIAALTTVETTLIPTTYSNNTEIQRSLKPIVTSVSSFNETFPTSSSFPSIDQQQVPQITSRKRPNIVVLNESIVQSSHLLQACTICQSKFIGIDSLNHHYKTAHNTQSLPISANSTPMVTVPTANITTTTTWENYLPQNLQTPIQSCKVEQDVLEKSQLQINDHNMNATQKEQTTSVQFLNKRSSKNEIKILDMQQSFAQHQYNYPNLIHFEQRTLSSLNSEQINSLSAFPLVETQTQAETFTSSPTANTVSSIVPKKSDIITESSDCITVKYLALQKSYERLRLKCQRLKHKKRFKNTLKLKTPRFQCRICNLKFSTILQLLRHRQTASYHQPRRQHAYFFATCPGCEKFFCHKIALFNHMRYICQSLPLSWFKSQIRTFKCRCCRLITFTHWRLYRRHEVKCRLRKLKQLQSKKSTQTDAINAVRSIVNSSKNLLPNRKIVSQTLKRKREKSQTTDHICMICKKVYPSSSSLNQHRITHSNLRSFQCEICNRIFKRRNGLTQHVRGFHMKLKPFQCPICKHTFALKADMKRCKHTIMNRSSKKSRKNAN